MSDLLERLIQGVRRDAGIRRRRRLQPLGGPGDKIYPPTYPAERRGDPPRHVFERRRLGGQDLLCVLLDSVQSQANRLEEALQALRRDGRLAFPAIAVDFSGTEVADLGRITSLEAPHRVFDAIIRDAQLNGRPFRDTEEGRRLIQASPRRARAVFELSPTALVFGAWNSTGEGGGLGAKFPRAVVSEIVGVGVALDRVGDEERPSGKRTGSRIDPLGIRSGVRVYKTRTGWSLEPEEGAKEVRPSEVNHSNIAPTVEPLGVSVDHAVHSFTLSFAALRRLHFADAEPESPEVHAAGAAVLASLGLAAAVAQDGAGYFLRSRCDLVPEASQSDSGTFEWVCSDGSVEPLSLGLDEACSLVGEAVDRAATFGLRWQTADLVLQPQPKLVQLVVRSRAQALSGVSETEADED